MAHPHDVADSVHCVWRPRVLLRVSELGEAMKYAWLLVLPYVVTVTTYSFTSSGYPRYTNYRVDEINFHGNKEQAEDLAAALNEAHERRTHTKNEITGVTDDKGKLLYWKGTTDFNYPTACGQDDCGKETK